MRIVCQRYFAPVWGAGNLLGLLAHCAATYAATSARLELTMETADVKPQLCNPDVATSLDNLIGVLAVEGQGRPSGFLGWTIIAFHALSASFPRGASALLLHGFSVQGAIGSMNGTGTACTGTSRWR